MNGMAPHRDRLSVVLFGGVLLALVAISLQLFGITYPALLDLPNHLARHAIQCGGGQAGGLGDYYEFGMRLVPNLTADIIYAFDWACRDIFLTNRILIQIAILNLIASVYVLHFVLWGRLSIWPAASCLLVYNTAFSFGFENYVLAAPFALYAFAAWVGLSERSAVLRLGLMVPLSTGLYIAHIMVFGFLILLIFGWELERLITGYRDGSTSKEGSFSRLVGLALIILPASASFLFILFTSPPQESSEILFGGLVRRLDVLLSSTTPMPLGYIDDPHLDLHIATIAFLAGVILLGRITGVLRFDRRMRWVLILCFVVVLFAPWRFGGVWWTQVRYPYLLGAILIASFHWQIRLKAQALLALAVLALFLTRTEVTKRVWTQHEREVKELLAAFEDLPREARILPSFLTFNDTFIMHTHSISYAGIRQGVFIPTLFNGANTLEPRPAYRDIVGPQEFPPRLPWLLAERVAHAHGTTIALAKGRYWSGWPDNFTHILVFGPEGAKIDALEKMSVNVRRGSFFSLHEIRCEQAWNKDPCIGVIGVQTGPP